MKFFHSLLSVELNSQFISELIHFSVAAIESLFDYAASLIQKY